MVNLARKLNHVTMGSYNLLTAILYSQYSTLGSSTSFSFTNLTPDDNTPYVMRVVVRPSAPGSMKTTIRRQIWIPGMKLRIVFFTSYM